MVGRFINANADKFQLILFTIQEVTSSLIIGGTITEPELRTTCETTGKFLLIELCLLAVILHCGTKRQVSHDQ